MKQVDPTKFTLVDDPFAEDVSTRIRDEQEEIIRELHRELETVDRRVTRSRARALSIPLRSPAPDTSTTRRESIRRGKLPVRTSRTRANEAVRLVETQSSQAAEVGEEVPQEVRTGATADPEYDEEGNVLTDGDMPSSAESSSGSDEEF